MSLLWRETGQDADFRTRAFQGLRRFQEAPRVERTERGLTVARSGRVRLLRHPAPSPDHAGGRAPVLFVPSLINPPHVLDLAPDNSLLGFLAARGHATYQIDWGTPTIADAREDIGAHATDRLLPLMAQFDEPPILVGYCLGGTIAIAAAVLAPCRAIATIAAPWHFAAYPREFAQQTKAAWDATRPVNEALGQMPMEVLQAGFWGLDPARTVRKYANFADIAEEDPRHAAFLLLEDWVNEGAPLTFAAARQLIEDFYGADDPGRGAWRVVGRTIDPAMLTCPSLAIASATDRLVPHNATPPANERLTLDLGHVGMVVGRAARDRLWNPLSAWLAEQGG